MSIEKFKTVLKNEQKIILNDIEHNHTKKHHWIWYGFPQNPPSEIIPNLSQISFKYIISIPEVKLFLEDDFLRSYYLEAINMLLHRLNKNVKEKNGGVFFSSSDDLKKFKSHLQLFIGVLNVINTDNKYEDILEKLNQINNKFFHVKPFVINSDEIYKNVNPQHVKKDKKQLNRRKNLINRSMIESLINKEDIVVYDYKNLLSKEKNDLPELVIVNTSKNIDLSKVPKNYTYKKVNNKTVEIKSGNKLLGIIIFLRGKENNIKKCCVKLGGNYYLGLYHFYKNNIIFFDNYGIDKNQLPTINRNNHLNYSDETI